VHKGQKMELQQALELADTFERDDTISRSASAVRTLAAKLREMNQEYYRYTGVKFFDEPKSNAT